MSTNLALLFPSIELLPECPMINETNVYIFRSENLKSWITIDKKEVSEREYTLLSTLFQEIKPNSTASSLTEKWIQFLYNNGTIPLKDATHIRAIQLHIKGNEGMEPYLEEAVKAFFDNGVQLVFTSPQEAVLIERKYSYVNTLDDFSSFMGALESDFFIKIKMYIGKFYSTSTSFSPHFLMEKEWFLKGLSRNRAEQIYTMEKTFPFSLIDQISEEMKEVLRNEILEPIEYDMELLQSIQLLFENGFNATETAKKLHVHRNTLQYRLTKFQDITGITVRNFNGALVAYCASLIAIGDEDKTHN